jgi:endothelin-converting enzyme
VPQNYTLGPNRTLIVNDIDYFKNLSQLIQSTSRETLHDYFEWRTIATNSGRLHKNFTAPMRQFSNVLLGKEEKAVGERWRTCVGEVDAVLGHLLGNAFIQRKFTLNDKRLGDQIINDIKQVFSENLKGLDWMSEDAKKVAAMKGEK